MEPQINFCTSADGTRIAYAICGDGPPLVQVSGWSATIEHDYECDGGGLGNVVEALSSRCTLMLIDRRGMGASERQPHRITLSATAEDLEAAVRAAGWDSFDLFGHSDGCLVAAAYAVEAGERVRRLVLWAPFSRWLSFVTPLFVEAMQALVRENWGVARRSFSQALLPSGPISLQRHTADAFREAMSSDIAGEYLEFQRVTDIQPILASIRQPTLVLHRRGDRSVPITEGRAVAAAIPNAKFVPLEGDHHPATDPSSFLPYVWDFLGYGAESDEAVTTTTHTFSGTAVILFADIVDSTALTERLGDAAFRERARELDEALRRAIAANGGTAIDGKLLGDGVLATFGAAREAIACAAACHEAAKNGGLALHVGIHAGDVLREEGNVYGGAVNIASRISNEAAAGETLVSGTVRDLARTSAGVRSRTAASAS